MSFLLFSINIDFYMYSRSLFSQEPWSAITLLTPVGLNHLFHIWYIHLCDFLPLTLLQNFLSTARLTPFHGMESYLIPLHILSTSSTHDKSLRAIFSTCTLLMMMIMMVMLLSNVFLINCLVFARILPSLCSIISLDHTS